MERFLGSYSSYIYSLLRIVAGLLFLMHGTQKLFGWPLKLPMPVDTMTTAIGVFEVIAGLMIIIGLFASIFAFIASGMLAVGYFMIHQPTGTWPIQNGGEPAVLLCFIFLYIAARGSGAFSVDAMRRRNVSAGK
ncbi:MAG: DoxX family protein [Acidobacteriota bacterium]